MTSKPFPFNPRQIKARVDNFVIAQHRAKRILATALHNQRQRVDQYQKYQQDLIREEHEEAEQLRRDATAQQSNTEQEILTDYEGQAEGYSLRYPNNWNKHGISMFSKKKPLMDKSNLMLLGPTGVGKTLLVETMARLVDIPVAISDCTKLTQAGYVGDDVDTTIHSLLTACDWQPSLAETGIVVLDEVDKLARPAIGHGRDIGGEGVQQALLKLMEGTTLTISDKNRPGRIRTGLGGQAPSGGMNEREVYSIDTSNILFIFCGAFTGLDKIIEARLGKRSIGFGANIQSSFFMPSSHRLSDPAEENNILNHVISEDLQNYGFIPEFIGRIPRIVPLHPLREDDLVSILQDPEDSLLTRYRHVFALDGAILQFTNGAIRQVAKRAMGDSTPGQGPSDGARGLRRIMEEILERPQYEVPGGDIRYVLITEDVAQGKEDPIYFKRNDKDAFLERIKREEENYTVRTQKKSDSTTGHTGKGNHSRRSSKKSNERDKEREGTGGILMEETGKGGVR